MIGVCIGVGEYQPLAERLYPTMSRKLYEQTALNAARRQLDLPIQFLDRRYCWSRFPDVREAVEEAACSKSVSWNSAEDYVWWFSVPV